MVTERLTRGDKGREGTAAPPSSAGAHALSAMGLARAKTALGVVTVAMVILASQASAQTCTPRDRARQQVDAGTQVERGPRWIRTDCCLEICTGRQHNRSGWFALCGLTAPPSSMVAPFPFVLDARRSVTLSERINCDSGELEACRGHGVRSSCSVHILASQKVLSL